MVPIFALFCFIVGSMWLALAVVLGVAARAVMPYPSVIHTFAMDGAVLAAVLGTVSLAFAGMLAW